MRHPLCSPLATLVLLLCGACAPLPSKEAVLDPDEDGSPWPEDCDSLEPAVHPGAAELPYDGVDQDCDPGTPDDDLDGDGYVAAQDCDEGTASISPGQDDTTQDGVDQNCDLVDGTDLDGDAEASLATGGPDCDDEDPGVHSGSQETCDGRDEDCDGSVDEDAADASTLYIDADGDGWGDEGATISSCGGEGLVERAGDCDDADAAVSPDAVEICDERDVDEDCDGLADDDDESVDSATWGVFYSDLDGDGWGGDEVLACDLALGWVEVAGDCDDADAAVNPSATEACDEGDVDEDCDGLADDDDESVDDSTFSRWFADDDADGFGDETDGGTLACDASTGLVANADDCDDAETAVNPGAEEGVGDGVDQDCDDQEICWADEDRDGYPGGERVASIDEDCWDLGEALDGVATDCDDADASIYPGAEEICEDGEINDCTDWDAEDPVASAMETCALSEERSLADADVTLLGGAASDYAGYALAGGGDVDGDGIDDLLVGAVGEDSGGSKAGAAYVWAGGTYDDASLSDVGTRLQGAASQSAGQGLDMGDLDEDGYADVLVGAPNEISGIVNVDCGAAYLYWGPLSGNVALADADLVLDASTYYSYAGKRVRVAEDLDGDGARDILVGAPSYYGRGPGVAYVASGVASGTLALESGAMGYGGLSTSDYAGNGVDAGDLDGDGAADLLIGSMGVDCSSYTYCGAVYLLAGPMDDTRTLADADTILVGSDNQAAGRDLVSGTDLDGDGLQDLAIGASNAWEGRVYIVAAPSGGTSALSALSVVLSGELTDDAFGYTLDQAGDVDLDGSADLIVGAHGEDTGGHLAGAAYLFLGPFDGPSSASDARAKWYAGAAGDYAGSAVAGAGDLDADGFPDLAIGAYFTDMSSTAKDTGATYILFGRGY